MDITSEYDAQARQATEIPMAPPKTQHTSLPCNNDYVVQYYSLLKQKDGTRGGWSLEWPHSGSLCPR